MDDNLTFTPNFTGVNINAFKNYSFDYSLMPGLTSMLSGANIDFSTASTADLLSALNVEIRRLSQTMLSSLSSEIIHPWDAIKLTLFGPDYKFPVLEEVEIPEGITTQSIIDKLKDHERSFRSNLIDYMHNKDQYEVTGFLEHPSIISELSGDNCFTVTDQRFKNYVETVEMLNNIDRENINESNYLDYANKISYCLTKIISQRTV